MMKNVLKLYSAFLF